MHILFFSEQFMDYHIYTRVLSSLCPNTSLGFCDYWRWWSFSLRLSV